MRRTPSGLGGSGLPGNAGQPSKRQKRSDILDSLGGLSSIGGLGQRSSASKSSGGFGKQLEAAASSAGVGGFGKNASAADMEAMKAWMTESDAGATPTASSASTPAPTTQSAAVSVAAEPPVATVVSQSAPQVAEPAALASASPAAADSALQSSATASAGNGKVALETGGGEAPTSAEEAAAEDMTVAHVTIDNVGQGWRTLFANAKDHWDVLDEAGRGVFWHSESGCCFEWHQSIGILFQFGEEDVKGEPQKFPIWSLDLPEQSAWIWDMLPLPSTDPAAQPPPTTDEVSTGDQAPCKEAPAEPKVKSPVDPAAGGMLPPAVPFKKKPRPQVPLFSRPSCDDDDDDAEDSMPLNTEVLDNNVWERKCLALERRSGMTTTAPASSPASSSAAASSAAGSSGGVALALAAAEAALGDAPDGEDAVRATVAPMPMPRGPLDDDSDDDAAPSLGLGLAEEGPAPALPTAPVAAKPKALDLELDMFGEPIEPDA